MRGRYLAKFWCTLAWIEQYWNDAKAWTRRRYDYTLPKLKAEFPVALDTACPITQIRKFMQRSLDHVTALREIGRYGDFGRIDGLRKQYKRSARSPPSRCHPLLQALALLARHISLAGASAKSPATGGPTSSR